MVLLRRLSRLNLSLSSLALFQKPTSRKPEQRRRRRRLSAPPHAKCQNGRVGSGPAPAKPRNSQSMSVQLTGLVFFFLSSKHTRAHKVAQNKRQCLPLACWYCRGRIALITQALACHNTLVTFSPGSSRHMPKSAAAAARNLPASQLSSIGRAITLAYAHLPWLVISFLSGYMLNKHHGSSLTLGLSLSLPLSLCPAPARPTCFLCTNHVRQFSYPPFALMLRHSLSLLKTSCFTALSIWALGPVSESAVLDV